MPSERNRALALNAEILVLMPSVRRHLVDERATASGCSGLAGKHEDGILPATPWAFNKVVLRYPR